KVKGKEVEAVSHTGTPLGPTSKVVELKETVTTDDSQFTRTCADVADYVARHGRLPGAGGLGSTPGPPGAYLRPLAGVALVLRAGKEVPAKVEVRPTKLAVAKYVSDDAARLWGWVIFPPNFRAPHLMDVAKRQAWTLKPA